MEILDYEEVVSDFNRKLITKLRSHGAEAEYLEMWVPDEDPVKSILNMVEAAQAYGRQEIRVRVSRKTVSASQLESLRHEVGKIGTISVTDEDLSLIITVIDL